MIGERHLTIEACNLIACQINRDNLKKIIMTKYSKKAQEKIELVMHEFKHGKLKSGKGGKGGIVKSREQAIAIGISEAREAGLKVPKENV